MCGDDLALLRKSRRDRARSNHNQRQLNDDFGRAVVLKHPAAGTRAKTPSPRRTDDR
jgi:hypothetical protein